MTELEATLRDWFASDNLAAILGLIESLMSQRDRAEQMAAADQTALVEMVRERAKQVADMEHPEPVGDAGETPRPRPRQPARRQAAALPRRRPVRDEGQGEALDII